MRNTASNYSGFGGYPIASLYPDMGDMMNQTMATIPDPDEQESLSGQEPNSKVKPAVNPKSRTQLWIALAVIVGLVFAFSKG